MPAVIEAGAPYVAMHWRGHSADMQSLAVYDDVMAAVCRELASRRDALLGAGLRQDLLVLDPGLGFGGLHIVFGYLMGRAGHGREG